MIRAILIDPFGCKIRYVALQPDQLQRQVYRHVRSAPIEGVLLANGDTAWYARRGLTGGQCYFAMPSLLGPAAIGGCCVISGQSGDCILTLDDIDAALLWLSEPYL